MPFWWVDNICHLFAVTSCDMATQVEQQHFIYLGSTNKVSIWSPFVYYAWRYHPLDRMVQWFKKKPRIFKGYLSINPLNTGSVSLWDLKLVITVPADALAHNSARSPADTVLTTNLILCSSMFLWLSMISYHICGMNYVRWYGPSDLKISRNTGVFTHWGQDKMAAISHMTYSKAFSWMKMFEFRLQFHWSLFPRVQLITFQHWFK